MRHFLTAKSVFLCLKFFFLQIAFCAVMGGLSAQNNAHQEQSDSLWKEKARDLLRGAYGVVDSSFNYGYADSLVARSRIILDSLSKAEVTGLNKLFAGLQLMEGNLNRLQGHYSDALKNYD